MLPKDVWSVKLIVSMGTDCRIYRDHIAELWGRTPIECYGNSESVVVATQLWDYDSMVFFPNLNFLEFIPEREHALQLGNPGHRLRTVLMDELVQGETYELVITNFHGGIMTRYRLGDMVRITGLKNDRTGVALPQMVFERRADDLIDLGFMRLTERVIWQAINNARIPYKEWTARKELGDTPSLHLYIETEPGYETTPDSIATAIYDQIKALDDGLYIYKDLSSLESLIGFKPIRVTILPHGTFSSYKNKRAAEGADLAHLKPPHINPNDNVLSQLGVGAPVSAGQR
jgi:hypothetical protein